MKLVFFTVFISCLLFSCSEDSDQKNNFINEWTSDKSIQLNKNIVEDEELNIKAYLAHFKNLKMKESGTGLRYMIYENGDGEKAQSGDSAFVNIRIQLLDGTFCYQTDSSELDEFLIDRNHIESGVNEAVQFMHKGDRAKLIIPSHLAHCLVGDRDKIPPISILFVDIHLVDLVK